MNLATIRVVGQWQGVDDVACSPAFVVRDMGLAPLRRLAKDLSLPVFHYARGAASVLVIAPDGGPRHLRRWDAAEIGVELSAATEFDFLGFKYVAQTFSEALVRHYQALVNA
jgi:hypothetical protein